MMPISQTDRIRSHWSPSVSEIHRSAGDAIELVLLEGSHVERIVLPIDGAEVAFLRAEHAIGECAERGRVVSVDARFRDRIVIQLEDAA